MTGNLKRVTVCLLLVLLNSSIIYAELTIKEVVNSYGTKELVFYSKRKEVAKQTVDAFGNIIKTSGKIPDGIVKQYYKSGNLMFEFIYKDGKRKGISKNYYENGNLLAEINFKNNKKEGTEKIYYESSKLKSELIYKKGKLEGISKKYYEGGGITFRN